MLIIFWVCFVSFGATDKVLLISQTYAILLEEKKILK
jgi:hypothetical protein